MIAAPTNATHPHAPVEVFRAERYVLHELDMATLRTLIETGLTPREALAVLRRELTRGLGIAPRSTRC